MKKFDAPMAAAKAVALCSRDEAIPVLFDRSQLTKHLLGGQRLPQLSTAYPINLPTAEERESDL